MTMTPTDQAGWLADKICNGGDYAKEAALVLVQQAIEIERLRQLLAECSQYVISAAGAEHMLDGFRWRRQPIDDLVDRLHWALEGTARPRA